MAKKLLPNLAGLGLIAFGTVAPSDAIVSFLQGDGNSGSEFLGQGATLFRAVVVVIGVYMVAVTSLLPRQRLATDTAEAEETGGVHVLIIAGLFALAAGLRLYGLETGIWYDEMLTHVRYMPLTVGQIVSTFDDANNHVLFTIAAKVSISTFGDTAFAFRLPAALFGVASIVALYAFARQVSTPLVALFSVALLTVSYHHIWFSQNARGYTALLFFALLSSAFMLRAMDRNSPSLWVAFAVTGALGAYTHLSMGFVAIAQFAVYAGHVWTNREDYSRPWWVGLIYGFVPLGLLTLLAYALVLPDIFAGNLLGSGLQDERLAWLNPFWALMEIVNALRVGFAGGAVGLAAALIFGLGMLDFLIKRPAVVALFLIPTVTGFLLMTSIGYTLFPRFFFFAMGFAVVIVINGAVVLAGYVSRLLGVTGSRGWWLPTAICLGIVGASILSLRYVYAPKQNFERAIAYVEENLEPGDTVVALGIADFPLNTYYGKGWETLKTVEELDGLRARTDRTWVVHTMPVHARTVYEDVLSVLDQDYSLAETFFGTLNGGQVVVHVENPPEG